MPSVDYHLELSGRSFQRKKRNAVVHYLQNFCCNVFFVLLKFVRQASVSFVSTGPSNYNSRRVDNVQPALHYLSNHSTARPAPKNITYMCVSPLGVSHLCAKA
jgi:hypothetical protein